MENKEFKDIKESLITELCELKKKNPKTPTDLQSMSWITDMLKDMAEKEYYDKVIEAMDNYDYDDGVSLRNYPMSGEYSMRRGRSPMTGRYVSRDMERRMYDNRMNSYDHGYSGHSITDRMIDSLERLYDGAETEHQRNEIRAEIEHLRNK